MRRTSSATQRRSRRVPGGFTSRPPINAVMHVMIFSILKNGYVPPGAALPETATAAGIGPRKRGQDVGMNSHRCPLRPHHQQGAAGAVADVVMAAWCMIDRVPSATTGAPFQAAQLGGEARMIEQFHLAAVQQRQGVAVDVVLRVLADV